MPLDTFKPKGPSKLTKNNSGGADTKDYPIIGIVKDNIDPTRAGRIRVALQDGKGAVSPDEGGGWVTVQHLSSFFGTVRPNAGGGSEDYGSYIDNSSSYGQWQAPPDIGTKVVCIFVNGDTNAGFYIGAIPEPETLQMVPAIGASEAVTLNEAEAKGYGGATRLPVTNLNTNNKDKADSDEFLDTPRPVHSYTASIMNQQGILRDPIRGPISSSASREAASRVGWGVNTPGRPIYEGGYTDENLPDNLKQSNAEQLKVVARRGGHSIVMDDGDIIGRDQLIRIRTSLGHQILMSDDGQTLMILHSNGQSYIELGKEGTVDIFSTNSINMRTQGDFNIHADRDINMHAMENLNIQAKNIHTVSEEEIKFKAGKDYKISTSNNFTIKSGAASAINAGGQASMVAGAEAFVNGSKVNLNSGNASLTPEEVPIIPIVAQADTLYDKEVGWAAAPAKLLTIASRAPAHYPWVNAGMGVDISNSPDADDNLPEPSSSAVQEVNRQAEATNPTPPEVATVASVPQVNNVSETIDQGTTNAVLAASATSAATGPASDAVETGASIINGSSLSGINSALNIASTVGEITDTANQIAGSVNEASIALGSFAQTPEQLVQSGILKPGSDALATGLASAGLSLTNTMPGTIFTGVPGAESMEQLAENTTAQAASLVNIMQLAQQQLTDAGVINGSESTMQTAGLIAASATAGTENVINLISQVSSTIIQPSDINLSFTDPISGAISTSQLSTGSLIPNLSGSTQQGTNLINTLTSTVSSLTSVSSGAQNVLGMIGSGISAAKLSGSLGGLGGISNSLNALSGAGASLTSLLDSVKGISGSAFSAIKNSFGTLEPNKPQYLSDFAKQTASITAIAENSSSSQLSSTRSLSSLVSSVAGAANDITRIANNVNNTVNSITGSSSPLTTFSQITNTINVGTINNNLSSSINQIGGTINSISNTINSGGTTSQATSSLIDSVTGTNVNSLSNSISGAFNQINGMAGAATSLRNGLSGLANAAKTVQAGGLAAKASQLASGVSNLPGGIGAFSSVLNKAQGATNRIPGTEQLTSTMNDIQTQVTNGIGQVSSIVNTVGSLSGSSSLTSLASKAGGLTSSIASKLPIGQASQLLSSVSALGAGGASPIKLPDLGFNTMNRSSITAQVRDLLGNPKIPEPNLIGDIKDETISSLEQKSVEIRQQRNEISAELNAAIAERNRLADSVIELQNTLPEGDPATEEAYKAWIESVNKMNLILSKYTTVIEQDTATTSTLTSTRISAINSTTSASELIATSRRLGL
jgi:hypothetical protein